jgi:low affinity Fe/Cu permease
MSDTNFSRNKSASGWRRDSVKDVRNTGQDPSHQPGNGRGNHDALMARFARFCMEWAGTSWAFGLALLTVVVWLVTGPIFGYSDTWQLVINTGTTIVTFLMVFLIQRSQNKDSQAIQLKLNELVAAMKGASNRLIDVEDLTEEDLKTLAEHYRKLAELAEEHGGIGASHSVEEAVERHKEKAG